MKHKDVVEHMAYDDRSSESSGVPDCSVVLPTNSLGKWLSEAVQSILANLVIDRVECVVVLDGVRRPDEEWTEDSRVHLVGIERSRGLAHALNQGVLAGRGTFIARMDADDKSGPDRLSIQMAYLRAHPEVVAVGGRARLMRETGEVTMGQIGSVTGDDVRKRLLVRNVLVHPSVMFRRAPFEQVGGYDESMRTMEDYDLWMRLGVLGPIASLPETLIDYRVHDRQMSRQASWQGSHVRCIAKSRMALARDLGVPRIGASAVHLAWLAHQWARDQGLIEPGYVRALERTK